MGKAGRVIIFVLPFFMLFSSSCVISDLITETGQLANLRIHNFAFSSVQDGDYLGECILLVKAAVVRVQMSQGRAIVIELLRNDHGPGHDAREIIDRVRERQTLDVDAVAGSTKNSLVIRLVERSARISKEPIWQLIQS